MSEPPQSSGPDRNRAISDPTALGRVPRVLRWALAAVGLCVCLVGVWFVSCERATARAMPGLRVLGLDVSGLERAAIEARVHAWLEQRAAQRFSVSLADSRLVFEPKNVGFSGDASAVATSALAAGRARGFFGDFAGFITRWFRPEQVPCSGRFDPALLGNLFDDWQDSALKDAPFAGGMASDGATVSPLYPHSGRRIDRARAEAQLRNLVLTGIGDEPLATFVEVPKLDRAAVDRVVAEAQAMLGGSVELTSTDGSRHLLLGPAEIASVLRATPDAAQAKLELGCSAEALHPLLEPRRAALEQQPENARFVIDAQDHVRVEPGHSGLVLDDRAVALALCAAARAPEKKGALPLNPGTAPALSTEAAERAGIAGLVGTYTTRHACCQPRVENIHHIADLLDGTLVQPGQTFSVNQLVGPRTVKNGFRPAPSIEDGDMVDTVGGGVSQFATTLFNALFYGGYDILERQPHSYWFTRYPMGYDATLSYPHPDIVFKNDTEAGALIKAQYTDTTITVKIYGNNAGRRVRAEVSPRQNIVTPPVEFIPNPRLDADQEKTREGGMIGWTVTVKRTLTFADGKIKEERRKVTYKPRARRVEVHPCRIPAGEPGHTGERCPKPEKDDADVTSEVADPGAK